MMRTIRRIGLGVLVAGGTLIGPGCARKASTTGPASQPVTPMAETKPATETTRPDATSRPAPASEPATTRPASQPASQPAPRHQVIAYGPDGKKLDWIEVERWAEDVSAGRVVGRWAGTNKMIIKVEGARQVKLKLGKLPIVSGRRIVLHIEDARMELKRSLLPTVRLRRSHTGAWSAVKSEQE